MRHAIFVPCYIVGWSRGSGLGTTRAPPCGRSGFLARLHAAAERGQRRREAGRALPPGLLVRIVASMANLQTADCKKILASLASIGTREVRAGRKFTIPGLVTLKLKTTPATKAGNRLMFGRVVHVKAKPAKKVIKAYIASALKKSISD